jgi:hypothetical protein
MDENQMLKYLLNHDYTKLKDIPPKEKCKLFIKAGDNALERACLITAEIYYSMAGKQIPREKLIKCGDACVEKWFNANFSNEGYPDGWIESALSAYKFAGHEGGFDTVINYYISKNMWNRAFSILILLTKNEKIDEKKIMEYSYLFYKNDIDKLVEYGYSGAIMPKQDFYKKNPVARKISEGSIDWKLITSVDIINASYSVLKNTLETMPDKIKGKIVSDFLEALI